MFRIINHGGFAEVTNASGERLFCHVSVEKARAKIESDWRRDGAYCFADTALIPVIQIEEV